MGDRYPIDVARGKLQDKGPTASQVVTVAAMFPLGGLLLVLSGIALAGSVVGVVVLAPLFLLFSPVLVPAALLLALAVTGFLTSGALGCTGVSSLAYTMRQARAILQQGPEQIDYAKRRVAETAGHLGAEDEGSGARGVGPAGGVEEDMSAAGAEGSCASGRQRADSICNLYYGVALSSLQ